MKCTCFLFSPKMLVKLHNGCTTFFGVNYATQSVFVVRFYNVFNIDKVISLRSICKTSVPEIDRAALNTPLVTYLQHLHVDQIRGTAEPD